MIEILFASNMGLNSYNFFSSAPTSFKYEKSGKSIPGSSYIDLMDSVVTVDVRHDTQQFPPPLARNNEKVEDALQKHFLTFFLPHPVTAFLEFFLF